MRSDLPPPYTPPPTHNLNPADSREAAAPHYTHYQSEEAYYPAEDNDRLTDLYPTNQPPAQLTHPTGRFIDSDHQAVGYTLPHIEATFEGNYFKGVIGAMEICPFKITVRVANTQVRNENTHPIAIFKNKYAERVLKRDPQISGYSGVREVRLVGNSKLPEDLSVEQELIWTGGYDDMVKLAKRHGKNQFVPLDPKEGTPMPRQHVEVKPEYYGTTDSLRNAIKRCMVEPEAFKKEQDKVSQGYTKRLDELSAQEEMAALGY